MINVQHRKPSIYSPRVHICLHVYHPKHPVEFPQDIKLLLKKQKELDAAANDKKAKAALSRGTQLAAEPWSIGVGISPGMVGYNELSVTNTTISGCVSRLTFTPLICLSQMYVYIYLHIYIYIYIYYIYTYTLYIHIYM